ncbi:MAG: sporulation integral membrane protein YtvI [Clostridia bacterium]|nr:sporulation integral membrane protein YtvI [Clostridia bacterium]
MTDVERKRKWIINVAFYAMLLALGYFLYKYAFGLCFPILFAFVIAVMLQRPKNFITKKTFIKKGMASTICVFGLLLIAGAVVVLIGVRAAEEVKGFINYVALQFQNIDSIINTVETSILSFVGKLPGFISENVSDSIASIFTQLREFIAGTNTQLPEQITGGLSESFSLSWITAPITGVISTASRIPSLLIGIVVTIVCACFMTADYDKITNFVYCQFPKEKRKDVTRAKQLLKLNLGKMAKAYALIMLVTFTEIFIGLTVLQLLGIFQSSYIAVIAVVTAIVDVIPVLGTGTIVLPWAAYSLIVGDYGMAIGLMVIYVTVTVIRQIVEPKLVAGQLGLPPFVTLIAMYLGLKIFGVLGVFVLPIVIIMLKLLNDEGIIDLWKSPSRVRAEENAENAIQNSETREGSDEKASDAPPTDEEPTT